MNKGPGNKPQLLVCYLCGQQFGTASLKIHIPQCYKKKLEVWHNGDPATRGKKPKDPATVDTSAAEHMSKEDFNNQQFEAFNTNMEQCPNCGRTFLPDRLVVHLRSCKGGGAGSKPPGGKERPMSQAGSPGGSRPKSSAGDDGNKRQKGEKPTMLVCYLCGQQFGSASLNIHIPQCYKKKLEVWQNGDPATRGKKPKDPATVDIQAAGNMTKEEFNNQQFGEFAGNLEPCPNCGRKFLPDRLQVHLRSCKGGGVGSKPIAGKAPPPRPGTQGGMGGGGGMSGGGGGGPSSPDEGNKRQKGEKPTMLVCYLCGQQFGSASLNIHIPQCYKKKLEVWQNGDPATRGKKPKDPATVDITAAGNMTKEEFNNQQFGEFAGNLEPCPNCGRKFLPDRLQVHLRSCKGGGVGSKPVGKPSAQTQRPTTGTSESSVSTQPQRPNTNAASPGRPPPSQGRLGGGGGGGGGFEPPTSSQGPKKKLPPKLRALQKILFDDVDSNHDGVINIGELRNMVKDVDATCSEEDVNTLMSSLDLNRDGVVDRAEWDQMTRAVKAQSSANPMSNRLPPEQPHLERSCESCGTVEHDSKARFCSNCGSKLTDGSKPPAPKAAVCSACGENLDPNARFCASCGAKATAPEPPTSSPTTAPAPRNNVNTAQDDDDDDGQGGGGGGMITCPNCEMDCEADAHFCDECGVAIGAADAPQVLGMLCNECGEVFAPDSKFCEECGGDLEPMFPSHHPGASTTQRGAAASSSASPTSARGGGGGAGGSSSPKSDYGGNIDYDEAQPTDHTPANRVECSYCGRKFMEENIERHESICGRTSQKRRPAFDSRKNRVKGTELEDHIHKIDLNSKKKAQEASKNKWKEQSTAFRQAMRQAREVDKVLKAGGNAKDLPPPTYSENSHYTPCPHCGRKFAPDVAERHIPKCKTTFNRPAPPPKRGGRR